MRYIYAVNLVKECQGKVVKQKYLVVIGMRVVLKCFQWQLKMQAINDATLTMCYEPTNL